MIDMKPILSEMRAFSEEMRELTNKAGKLAKEHGRDYGDWFNYYIAQLAAQKGYEKGRVCLSCEKQGVPYCVDCFTKEVNDAELRGAQVEREKLKEQGISLE